MKNEYERLRNFPLESGIVENVIWVDAVKVPAPNIFKIDIHNPGGYYRVTMKLFPSDDSRITVVVCLPDIAFWNGKFLGTGNGGHAGNIAEGALLAGVSRGYATANTDLGMPEDPDDCIGNKAAWEDFGHRATHLMTVVGKLMTTYFYKREPDYSYFMGGSTGGQQGMSEAQRYPHDYNGIICVSPAMNRVRLHAFFLWNWQQIHQNNHAAFTKELAKEWNDHVIRIYKNMCGSNEDDQFLFYPERINENPLEHPELRKVAKKMFTNEQILALKAIYNGPVDPVTREKIIAPFLPGTEAESLSLADISDRNNFSKEFFYLFRWIFGKEYDFMKFDFAKDMHTAIKELSPYLDADSPDLNAFKSCGGKLLVIGGSMDAIIPYTGFLEYYYRVIQKQGDLGETMKFMRFFLMPGFAHTVGGAGVQEIGLLGISAVPRDADHDVLCALEQWVEKEKAPECLLGTHLKHGTQGIESDYVRPAYVYPYVTEFIGGDSRDPQNYIPKVKKEGFTKKL